MVSVLAVSNASPLIVLSKLGYVVLLQKIFERVYIPSGVEREILGKDDKVRRAIKGLIQQGFVEVKSVENVPLVQILNMELALESRK